MGKVEAKAKKLLKGHDKEAKKVNKKVTHSADPVVRHAKKLLKQPY